MNSGDIILVKFPFANLAQTKQRPALVLRVISYSSQLYLCVIAMITTNIDLNKIQGDIEISGWKGAGLLHPSLIRLAKITTIESNLIVKNIGKLSEDDFIKVKAEFVSMFDFYKNNQL